MAKNQDKIMYYKFLTILIPLTFIIIGCSESKLENESSSPPIVNSEAQATTYLLNAIQTAKNGKIHDEKFNYDVALEQYNIALDYTNKILDEYPTSESARKLRYEEQLFDGKNLDEFKKFITLKIEQLQLIKSGIYSSIIFSSQDYSNLIGVVREILNPNFNDYKFIKIVNSNGEFWVSIPSKFEVHQKELLKVTGGIMVELISNDKSNFKFKNAISGGTLYISDNDLNLRKSYVNNKRHSESYGSDVDAIPGTSTAETKSFCSQSCGMIYPEGSYEYRNCYYSCTHE